IAHSPILSDKNLIQTDEREWIGAETDSNLFVQVQEIPEACKATFATILLSTSSSARQTR
ncbi:MAG: hypothetical protein V8S95_02405, partial [Odoribacter sp.]